MADNSTRSPDLHEDDAISNEFVEFSSSDDLADSPPSTPFDDVHDQEQRVQTPPTDIEESVDAAEDIRADVNVPSLQLQPEPERETTTSEPRVHSDEKRQTDPVDSINPHTVPSPKNTNYRRRRRLAQQRLLAISLGLLPVNQVDKTESRDDDDVNDEVGDTSNKGNCSRSSAGNTYPVSRRWLNRWCEYLSTTAMDEDAESRDIRSLGPVFMDPVPSSYSAVTSFDADSSMASLLPNSSMVESSSEFQDDEKLNEYVPEVVWRNLVTWYGVAVSHQLDRKLLNGAPSFNDRVEFEVCLLSAFSGIVAHQSRSFNRFEEIGYIEFQLRRIFGVSTVQLSDATRIWISEREVVPPLFRVLPNRNRMLNDHIQRDRKYILALEVRRLPATSKIIPSTGNVDGIIRRQLFADGGWPTGEPGESKGDLSKYFGLFGRSDGMSGKNIVDGHVLDDENEQEDSSKSSSKYVDAVVGLSQAVADSVRTGLTIGATRRELVDVVAVTEATCERVRATVEEIRRRESQLVERQARAEVLDKKLTALSGEIATRRRQLDVERSKVERECDAVERLVRAQSSRIRVDVGGTVFQTSRRTMIDRDPSSLLASMFDDGVGVLQPEDDGSFFIDRDGAHFRYIIEYLRSGATAAMPVDVPTARHLLCEAKFYRLRHLVKKIEDWLVERNASIV